MRVAITDGGNAHAIPPGCFPNPLYVYCRNENTVVWYGDGTGKDQGEKITRIVEAPDNATHYNMKSGRLHSVPAHIVGLVEKSFPWVHPIIGRSYKPEPPPAPPKPYTVHKKSAIGLTEGHMHRACSQCGSPEGEHWDTGCPDKAARRASRNTGCLKPEDWTPRPKLPQWVKDMATAALALTVYAVVLTVAVELDKWPVWLSAVMLSALVSCLIGVCGTIRYLQRGRRFDP